MFSARRPARFPALRAPGPRMPPVPRWIDGRRARRISPARRWRRRAPRTLRPEGPRPPPGAAGGRKAAPSGEAAEGGEGMRTSPRRGKDRCRCPRGCHERGARHRGPGATRARHPSPCPHRHGRAPRGRTRRTRPPSCRSRRRAPPWNRSGHGIDPGAASPGRSASRRASTDWTVSLSSTGTAPRSQPRPPSSERRTVVHSGNETPIAPCPYTAACSPKRRSFAEARPSLPYDSLLGKRRAEEAQWPRRRTAREGDTCPARCRHPPPCSTVHRARQGTAISAGTPIDLPSARASNAYSDRRCRASSAETALTKEDTARLESARNSRAFTGERAFHSA